MELMTGGRAEKLGGERALALVVVRDWAEVTTWTFSTKK
jgi:hypothetical protein